MNNSAKITEDKSVDSLMEEVPEDKRISKPFQSQAQRGKFYAMASRGEISKETVKEWEDATPKDKKLPKRKKMNKSRVEAIEILKAVSCPPDGEKLKKQDMVESMDDEAEKAFGAPPVGGEEKRISKPAKPKVSAGASPVGGESKRTGGSEGFTTPRGNPLSKADEEDDKDMEKALRAGAIVGMAKRARMHDFSAGAALPQPVIGTNRERSAYEPPVVPVRRVDIPEATPHVAPDFLTDCKSCGYVHKSLDDCPRCARIAAMGGEAQPIWSRGI